MDKWPTRVKPYYQSAEALKKTLADHIKELSRRQSLLYANSRYAVLLIFQAMDAAGKDGAIKHVMSGVNPQGCQVYSFKHPSAEELAPRFPLALHPQPPRTRAHRHLQPLLLRGSPRRASPSRNPPGPSPAPEALDDKDFWAKRYRSINDLEKHLDRNGTRILKFFLHLSKEEQRQRFLRRLEDPERNWKFSQRYR